MAITKTLLKRLKYQAEIKAGDSLRAKKNANGTVSWIFMKKSKHFPSPIRFKVGEFPDMPIDDAQFKVIQYRKLVVQGIHPKRHEEEKLEKKRLEQHKAESNKITLEELLSLYEKNREIMDTGNALKTVRDRYSCLFCVYGDYFQKPISMITFEVVDDILSNWFSQKLKKDGTPKKRQAQKATAYLRALFNWAIKRKMHDNQPVIEIPSNNVKINDYLDWDECDYLLGTIFNLTQEESDRSKLTEPRVLMCLAIGLTLLTGLRERDVLRLKWDDVSLDCNPKFKAFNQKQSKDVGIPITRQMKLFFDLCRKYKRNDYVFPSPKKENAPLAGNIGGMKVLNSTLGKFKHLKRYGKLNNLVLRHTFATAGYSLGFGIDVLHRITAHGSAGMNTNVATHAYINKDADVHMPYFEKINNAMTGEHEREALEAMTPIPVKEDELIAEDGGYVLPEKEEKK